MDNRMRLTAKVTTYIDIYVKSEEVDDLTNKFTSETLEQTDHILSTGNSVHTTRVINQEIEWETIENEDGEEIEIEEFKKGILWEKEKGKKKDTKG